jgi:purine-binding chemotaxis protein CheW
MSTSATTAKPGANLGGKYLALRLAGETYGLQILDVREIIMMMDITSVPRTPAFIKGVINLRGRVIPVMDLRSKFGLPAAEEGAERCIVVVTLGGADMGLIVDSVLEVTDIAAEAVEPTPSFGAGINTDFILGLGKTGDRVTILLDLENVLTRAEFEAITTNKGNAN